MALILSLLLYALLMVTSAILLLVSLSSSSAYHIPYYTLASLSLLANSLLAAPLFYLLALHIFLHTRRMTTYEYIQQRRHR